MKYDSAHQSPWKTAHTVFGAVLLTGLALHFYWPLTIQVYAETIPLKVIGTPLLLIGAVIILVAKRELEIHNQPSEPKATTTALIQSGLFKYSRNPLYLGLLIAFCGLAIAINKPWWLILAPLAVILTNYLLIIPEEQYLEKKFGEKYLSYKKSARRWI